VFPLSLATDWGVASQGPLAGPDTTGAAITKIAGEVAGI